MLKARVNTSFGNSPVPEFPITTGAMKAVTFKNEQTLHDKVVLQSFNITQNALKYEPASFN